MNSSSPEILLVDDSQNDVDLTLHTLNSPWQKTEISRAVTRHAATER